MLTREKAGDKGTPTDLAVPPLSICATLGVNPFLPGRPAQRAFPDFVVGGLCPLGSLPCFHRICMALAEGAAWRHLPVR